MSNNFAGFSGPFNDSMTGSAGNFPAGATPVMGPPAGRGAGPAADPDATVSFTVSGSSLTETVTESNGDSHSISFTQESGSSSVYQIAANADLPALPSGVTAPSFSFAGIGGATVTETITTSNGSETLTYGLVSGSSSNYQLESDLVSLSSSSTAPSYSFTLSNGSVTAESVTASYNGQSATHTVRLDSDAVYSVGSGTITETLVHQNAVETKLFTANSSGSSYSLTSDSTAYIALGSATTALDVNAQHRMEFTISNGSVTAEQIVTPSGSTATVNANANISYSVLAAGFVEEVITHGSSTSYVVFASGSNSNGIYTEIAHGSGSSVDLVGLQSQLSHLPTALAALV